MLTFGFQVWNRESVCACVCVVQTEGRIKFCVETQKDLCCSFREDFQSTHTHERTQAGRSVLSLPQRTFSLYTVNLFPGHKTLDDGGGGGWAVSFKYRLFCKVVFYQCLLEQKIQR